MKRAFQVIATNAWAGPLLEDATFHDDGKAYAERVAETLGLAPGSLRVVDGDADPRTGVLVNDPNVTEATPAPQPSKLDVLIDTLSKSKVLDATDKAALEALKA